MTRLARLEMHLAKREWVKVEREAIRLTRMEPLTPREKGLAYRAWGRAKIGLGEFYGAAERLTLAVPWALRAKDWDCLGHLRHDLGALYTTIGDVSAGVESLRAYLLDYDRYDDAKSLYGKVHFNLALAYKYQGKYHEATQEYEEAINWFTLRGNTHEKAMAHQNVAWLFCLLGQPQNARPHLDVADTYRETLPPAFDAEQICGWAFYYRATGQIGDAIDCVQEILLASRPGVDAHHRGQAAAIGGDIAVLLNQERQARLLLDVAISAAAEGDDPPLANQCAQLRAAVKRKWGDQEAAQ